MTDIIERHNFRVPMINRLIASAGLALVLLLANLNAAAPTSAAAFPCLPGWPGWPACPIILGVAGGGSITTEAGNTDFSLMATNIMPDDDAATEPITVGQVQW